MADPAVHVKIQRVDPPAEVTAFDLVIGQHAQDAGIERVVFPVFLQLEQSLLGFLGDVVAGSRPLFEGEIPELVRDPGVGEFREDGGGLVRGPHFAHDQLVLVDRDRHVPEDVGQGVRHLWLLRQSVEFLVGLGDQAGPFVIDGPLGLLIGLPEPVDSIIRRRGFHVAGDAHAPLLIVRCYAAGVHRADSVC